MTNTKPLTRRQRLRNKLNAAAAATTLSLHQRGIDRLIAVRVGDNMRLIRVEADEQARIVRNLKITDPVDEE